LAEQLAHGDLGVPRVVELEVGQVFDYRIVQPHLSGIDQLQYRKGRDGLAHRAQVHRGVRGDPVLPGVAIPRGVQHMTVLHHGDTRPRQSMAVEIVSDEGVNPIEIWAITAGGRGGSRQPCEEQDECGQQGHGRTHAHDTRIQKHNPPSGSSLKYSRGFPRIETRPKTCFVLHPTTPRLCRVKDEDTVRDVWATARHALVTASKLFRTRWVAIVVAMLCVQGALIWVLPLLTSLARWALRHIGISGINLYTVDAVVTSPLAAL